MTTKVKYIICAVIGVVALIAIVCRECVQYRRIARLNAQIEELTETTNIQKSQIDEMTARLMSARAELESTNKYTESVETILHESEELSHGIIETVCTDEESRDWYHNPVPDDICNILHEQLCNRACGCDKD